MEFVLAILLTLSAAFAVQHEVTVDQRPFSFPTDQWPLTSRDVMGTMTRPLRCDYTRVNSRMIWMMLTTGQVRQRCPTLSCTEWAFFLRESEIWQRGKTLGLPVKKLPNGYFLSANPKGHVNGNITQGCDSYRELLFSSEVVMVQDVLSKQVYTLVDLRARCGVDYHQPILSGHCRNRFCCDGCTPKMECVPKYTSQKFLVEGDRLQIYVKDIYLYTHCECQLRTS